MLPVLLVLLAGLQTAVNQSADLELVTSSADTCTSADKYRSAELLVSRYDPRLPKLHVVDGSEGLHEVRLSYYANEGLNFTVEWAPPHDCTFWYKAETNVVATRFDRKEVEVVGLNSNTSYLFRLYDVRHQTFSNFTRKVVTRIEKGKASSPPRITLLKQYKEKHGYLRYLPPDSMNGDLQAYELEYGAKGMKTRGKSFNGEKDHVTFGPLMCNTTYQVSLKAINSEGKRSVPAQSTLTTFCPKRANASSTEKTILFAINRTVYKKDISGDNIHSSIKIVSQMDENLVAMDFHVEKRLLYLVNTGGELSKEYLDPDLENTNNRHKLEKNGVEGISVDWVYDKIYLLIKSNETIKDHWIISVCDLEGQNCQNHKNIFTSKPKQIQVDPYSGYLYYVISNNEGDRLIRTNLTVHEHKFCNPEPEIMLKSSKLGYFVVSYKEDSIFIANIDVNRMFKVDLEDFEVTVLYETPLGDQQFNLVKSFVRLNGKNYWSSQKGFTIESVSAAEGYSSSVVDPVITTSIMRVFNTDTQPFPWPFNTVTHVETVLAATKGVIKWLPPWKHDKACSAFQHWKYRIHMRNTVNNTVQLYDNISDNKISVNNLYANTLYEVFILPYSKGGEAPHSTPVSGKTLQYEMNARISCVSRNRVHVLNMTGSIEREIELDASHVDNLILIPHRPKLFYTIDKDIVMYDTSVQHGKVIYTADSRVSTMKYEPLSQRLYFSNLVNANVYRMDLDGLLERTFHLSSQPNNVMPDGLLGKLCWFSEVRGIFCKNFNQTKEVTLIDTTEIFNSKVLSADLDPVSHNVFFIKIVPLSDFRFEYYEINIQNQNMNLIGKEQKISLSKPQLLSFPGRLINQYGNSLLKIYDVDGKSFSELQTSFKFDSIGTSFALQQMSHHNVIPSKIDQYSIRLSEHLGNYTIEWNPSISTANVSYSLTIKDKRYVIKNPYIHLDDLRPDEMVSIEITPFTEWANGNTIIKTLSTSEKIPSEPVNVRVYWNSVQGSNLTEYSVRWDPPMDKNGEIVDYSVTCKDLTTFENLCKDKRTKLDKITFQLDKADIEFTVQASTSIGLGPLSSGVSSEKTIENPPPLVFLGTLYPYRIILFDADSKQEEIFTINIEPTSLAYDSARNAVYILDRLGNLNFIHIHLKKNSDLIKSKAIKRLSSTATGLAIDTVGRYLYFTEKNKIKRIDLQNTDAGEDTVFHGKYELFQQIKYLNIESDGKLYFTNHNSDLYSLSLTQEHKFEAISTCISSSDEGNIISPLSRTDGFAILERNSEKVYIMEKKQSECKEIINLSSRSKVQIEVSTNNVFLLEETNLIVYNLINESINVNASLNFLSDVISLESKFHIFPISPNECKELTFEEESLDMNTTSSSIIIQLPIPIKPNTCNYSLPSTNFTIRYNQISNHGIEEDEKITSLYHFSSFSKYNEAHIRNLRSNTKYRICIEPRNIYTTGKIICGEATTHIAMPEAPTNLYALNISPSSVLLKFQQPEQEKSGKLTYFAYAQSDSSRISVIELQATKSNGDFIAKVDNLLSDTSYTIEIEAKNEMNQTSGRSNLFRIRTPKKPEFVTVIRRTPTSLQLQFNDDDFENLLSVSAATENTTVSITKDEAMSSTRDRSVIISGLESHTCYKINATFFYSNTENQRTFPIYKNCILTEIQIPETPTVPKLEVDDFIRIVWSDQDGNVWYELQQQSLNNESDWETIQNGTDNYFLTNSLQSGNYTFRVRAFTNYGKSNFTAPSHPIDIGNIRAESLKVKKSHDMIILAISLSITVFLCMAIGALGLYWKLKNLKKNERNFLDSKLRDLSILKHPNPWYDSHITEEDLKEIPQIKRDQIIKYDLLGSGAFSEVYMGTMRTMHDLEQSVAIKTPRKEATDTEKADFLTEAKIMWKFKHAHIVNLEAICLDADTHFLILELMEGALGKYLSENRPQSNMCKLSLLDLVEMSLDVAKGLEYLEEMKYVHRDIAARNCLVSKPINERRRVKIADFGLARDICKIDYYRTISKTQLPVRWMAPESLLDRKFTSQSDAWAFGILLWEIFTYGTNPYPTMNHQEVMEYVLRGMRLDCPKGTPQRLLCLMNSCWDMKPEARPSFNTCVQQISQLLEDQAMFQYLSTTCMPGYVSSCDGMFGGGQLTGQHTGQHTATTIPASQASTRKLDSSQTPKYLELIHLDYEVPPEKHELSCSCSVASRSLHYSNLKVSHVNCDQTTEPALTTCNENCKTEHDRDAGKPQADVKKEKLSESQTIDLPSNSEKTSHSLESLGSSRLSEDANTKSKDASEQTRDSSRLSEDAHAKNKDASEQTRDSRVNSQSSQDSVISSNADSGQGSSSSSGSTSDDDLALTSDQLNDKTHELQDKMKEYYRTSASQYDFPRFSMSDFQIN